MDIMGDNRGYVGSSGTPISATTPPSELWDQSDGTDFDGETDGAFILLPGTVDFGVLLNASDLQFVVARRMTDVWGSGTVADTFQKGTVTPRGLLISDGFDVAIAPSGAGSFDGGDFYVQCFDAATGLTQFGPDAAYSINPQTFGFSFDSLGATIAYASSPGDYYVYSYSTAANPFTFFCYPYGHTSDPSTLNWTTFTDADAGITFTPLANGRLQVDVDLSLKTSGNGDISISCADTGTGGSGATYPRTGSTHNPFSGSAVLIEAI